MQFWTNPGSGTLLYGHTCCTAHLAPISQAMQIRRARHAGHCWKKKEGIHKWLSPMDYYSWTHQCWPARKNVHHLLGAMFMDYSFMIYLTCWRCISMRSKRLIYFNVPTWSKLLIYSVFYEFVMSCFFSSFYSPYVILLKIVLLIPLKYHTGNRNCRLQ